MNKWFLDTQFESFAFHQAPSSHFLTSWNSTLRAHFDLNELQSSDFLLGAHLRIYINAKYYTSGVRQSFVDIQVLKDDFVSSVSLVSYKIFY